MIVLTNEWHKGQMARAVPGAYWSSEAKAWVLDAPEPRAAAVALRLFPTLGAEFPELRAARDTLSQDVRPFDMATAWQAEAGAFVRAPRVRKVLADKAWSLHPYQEVDLAYGAAVLEGHGAFYMGWERGLGKTLGTCCLIDHLDAQATLVVAPNTAKDSVWADALREFCPWVKVLVLPNHKAKRERMLEHAMELRAECEPFVLVVHYEALALIAGRKAGTTASGRKTVSIGSGWQDQGMWDLLVTDEDHRLANPDAQMFKAYRKVPATARLFLSGSIIQNHLEELWSPHRRAFPDRYKSKWRDWNDLYLDYVENGYGKVCVGVKPDKIEAMREALGAWMVYRRKEDELDMPPKTYVERRLELSKAQRKAYDQLQQECLTVLDGGGVVKADEGIAMLGRLRQIATGLDLMGEGVSDSTKLDACVEDILDAPDDEFVVFSWYKAGVTAIHERLKAKGVECFAVTGDTPHATRADYIARFQAGESRVFIGTLATLGESVNLQRANQVMRLDRSWNPQLNIQAEDRVFRMGQLRNVTITDYIAKDTVDELAVLPTLANKEALRAAILGH